MSVLVLVVDDEPDVRRDLRAQRFVTEFALSAPLRCPNVPVIMIAAYGDDATRLRATELGATRAAQSDLKWILRHGQKQDGGR